MRMLDYSIWSGSIALEILLLYRAFQTRAANLLSGFLPLHLLCSGAIVSALDRLSLSASSLRLHLLAH